MSASLIIKDKSENTPFLKVAAFRKNTRKTNPHKHDSYFELIYLSGGKGSHTIDNLTYEVRPPVVFFIRQDQVHHWDLDEDTEPDGFVLILKRRFFEKSLDGELKQFLAKISKLSCVYIAEDAAVGQLFKLLVHEKSMESEGSFSFTEAMMKGLFVKILQLTQQAVGPVSHRGELYRVFMELLIADHPKKNKVAHYAGLLNTTPQNLNAVCRKAVDRSAADVLAEYLIDEAKRLLTYTDNTITEIAFTLSFKDPSHFVKYFKRYAHCTPQAFREIM
jgi:AraC-like DNA-binding protein